jgi:hypothetical protein
MPSRGSDDFIIALHHIFTHLDDFSELWSVLPVPVLIGGLKFGRLSVAGDDESIAIVK